MPFRRISHGLFKPRVADQLSHDIDYVPLKNDMRAFVWAFANLNEVTLPRGAVRQLVDVDHHRAIIFPGRLALVLVDTNGKHYCY